jgi:multidrug efflux pump subunit AcrA (membrane-fusion protein)
MSDEHIQPPDEQSPVLRYVILAIAVLYVISTLYLLFDMHSRLATLEQKQANAQTKSEAVEKILEEKLHITNRQIEEQYNQLGSKVGMTQDELNKRTADLRRQQQASDARLTEEQKKAAAAIAGVSTEVGSVKTDLGGAKTDIASTKTDLEATKSKLEKAIGDLGVQSGLIARNHDELETLKHRGDRNYFEFTLQKNKRSPVSTISLELKKADAKKGRFTLNVIADDRTIEKKDRTMNEPMQFYSGRDRSLYEVLIYQVSKDKVTGYLSTPKAQ